METLERRLIERTNKGAYDMIDFFNKLIGEGRLKAYKTGKTLVPVKELESRRSYVLESASGEFYAFATEGDGAFYNDGEVSSNHEVCKVEKLLIGIARNHEIRTIKFENGAAVPSEWTSAVLEVENSKYFEGHAGVDRVTEEKGQISIYGEMDNLFKDVYEFVMGK